MALCSWSSVGTTVYPRAARRFLKSKPKMRRQTGDYEVDLTTQAQKRIHRQQRPNRRHQSAIRHDRQDQAVEHSRESDEYQQQRHCSNVVHADVERDAERKSQELDRLHQHQTRSEQQMRYQELTGLHPGDSESIPNATKSIIYHRKRRQVRCEWEENAEKFFGFKLEKIENSKILRKNESRRECVLDLAIETTEISFELYRKVRRVPRFSAVSIQVPRKPLISLVKLSLNEKRFLNVGSVEIDLNGSVVGDVTIDIVVEERQRFREVWWEAYDADELSMLSVVESFAEVSIIFLEASEKLLKNFKQLPGFSLLQRHCHRSDR